MVSLPEGLLCPPFKTLTLPSPLIVSPPGEPVMFSKLVAPPVVKFNSLVLLPVKLKFMVSVPAPPSSLVRSAAATAGVPFEPVNFNQIRSSPAPKSIESLFFNWASRTSSVPPLVFKVRFAVKAEDRSILNSTESEVSEPTMVKLSDAEKPVRPVISLELVAMLE